MNGAAEHATQHVNLAVAAKAPLERVVAFGQERGWRRLRLLSSAESSYDRDYLGETADTTQMTVLNVFHRDGIEPLRNLFDFTPEGRPDWDEQLGH